MKNRIVLLIVGCCALLLSSCLDSEEVHYELSRDCQILSFSLSSDSIPELNGVVFTIDQLTGNIFNMDSMSYGTKLDEKVICKVQLAPTVLACKVIQEATGDTIEWNKEDSLDFSKPVKFINTLWDGTTTKTYLARVNIHQVVPDSMVWNLYHKSIAAGKIVDQKVVVFDSEETSYYMYRQLADSKDAYHLYRAPITDATNWTKLNLTGLPTTGVVLSQMITYEGAIYVATISGQLYRSVDGQHWSMVEKAPVIKALMGSIPGEENSKQSSALCAVIEKEGALIYGVMNKEMQWEEGLPLEAAFPLTGFGNSVYNSMFRSRLLVVAGRDKEQNLTNAAWATSDGKVWAKMTDDATVPFVKQEGVTVAEYDDKLFMLSGINAAGKASSEIYFSRDGGINWSLSDTLVVMPQTFKARGFASIYVDKENFMYLFGGKEAAKSPVLDQIWRGRINRLGF